jgi:hypothetical protein
MEPWFSPVQLLASLGVTVPLFIYYTWRVYSLILEHNDAVKQLNNKSWIDNILTDGWNEDNITSQLTLNNIFLYFDSKLGSVRRSLRADIYSIILIGFIGTLLGMIGSFTTLLIAVGAKGLNPAVAITTLVKGGLSTALVSSLIAAIIACIVMSYLSFTDRKIVELKGKINKTCLDRYQQQSTNSMKLESEKLELFKNVKNKEPGEDYVPK